MQIHLITGHRTVTSNTEPVAIYCGACAEAAITARDNALASGEFPVVEQHVVDRGVLRYASDEAIAAFKPAPLEDKPVKGKAAARIAEIEKLLLEKDAIIVAKQLVAETLQSQLDELNKAAAAGEVSAADLVEDKSSLGDLRADSDPLPKLPS